jgi:hypothetical protein
LEVGIRTQYPWSELGLEGSNLAAEVYKLQSSDFEIHLRTGFRSLKTTRCRHRSLKTTRFQHTVCRSLKTTRFRHTVEVSRQLDFDIEYLEVSRQLDFDM